MNSNDNNSSAIDQLNLNIKRAPSADNFTENIDQKIWERNQSDDCISIKITQSVEITSVSDTDHGFLDLSRVDQDDKSIIRLNKLEFSGKDELRHQNGSVNYQNNDLSESDNTDIIDNKTRQSCSSVSDPTSKKRPYKDNRRTNVFQRISSKQQKSSLGDTDDKLLENDSQTLISPRPETSPSHYFCGTEYHDTREQIPNYQSQLNILRNNMITLIQSFGENLCSNFSLPDDDFIQSKTDILSKCNEMLGEAWLMPKVGRDCATLLCDLIREEKLLNYLTICMSHAGEIVSKEDTVVAAEMQQSVVKRHQYLVVAAQLYSQILTYDNIDNILGIISGDSTSETNDSTNYFESVELREPVKLFVEVVRQSWLVRNDLTLNREFVAILEAMTKHHENTNRLIVKAGGLRSLIYSCRSTDNVTLRRVSRALVNLGLFSDSDVLMSMAHYKVADWLFPLAFNNDDIIKYYACLAIVILSAHKELTQVVHMSGTIDLVLSFLNTHSPNRFASSEPSHFQGRSSRWLQRLLPLLKSDSVEAVSLASFHFVMEAKIKQGQGKTEIFKEIGAIEYFLKSASSIHKVAAQFSRQTLKILGIPVPFSLCHPVPIWTVDDVSNWLMHIGFEYLCPQFRQLNIDGDILLTIDSSIMEDDLDLTNGIIRHRLHREIIKLKLATAYETCDPTEVSDWLKTQVGPEYCQYAYAMIKAGIDRKFLVDITDQMLERDCFIGNSVHRTRILKAVEYLKTCKAKFRKDVQNAINDGASDTKNRTRNFFTTKSVPIASDHCDISNLIDESKIPNDKVLKNIDVFISYRRSNGAQLASLIMVHLKLRGYRVFLDIEKLPAGKFNENLLQSIQRSKNFLVVLTADSLDRCIGDIDQNDWVHREIVCAMVNGCNIIPVTDKFKFPTVNQLPEDMKDIVNYNAVPWTHDYQEACVDKIELFIENPEYKYPFSPPLHSTMSQELKISLSSPDINDDMLLNF